MSHKVFISYSTKDSDIATQLCHYLEENGITCWIAPRDISPSKIYAEAITEAIENTQYFLLILSKNSAEHESNAKWILRETSIADTCNKTIIPFHIDNSKVCKALALYVNHLQFIESIFTPTGTFPSILSAINGTSPDKMRTKKDVMFPKKLGYVKIIIVFSTVLFCCLFIFNSFISKSNSNSKKNLKKKAWNEITHAISVNKFDIAKTKLQFIKEQIPETPLYILEMTEELIKRCQEYKEEQLK